MSKRILVVDDDAANRRLALRMLARRADYHFWEAGSGEECLGLVEHQRFDCILLDISMPGMDGMMTCRELRARPCGASVRVIACTAHAGSRDRDQFLGNGFDGVLTKPFLIEELYASIEGTAP